MKISRWIYVPLLFAVLYFLFTYFFASLSGITYWLIYGTVMGSLTLYFSDRKVRKISKNSSDKRVFEVRQKREIVLLTDYEKAFALCRAAILSLKGYVINQEDLENGVIKAQGEVNWNFWGNKINFNLRKINKTLTEVEISVHPALKTTIISSGESWEIAEEIIKFLSAKDAEINQKVLVESAAILDTVYVKPFQKEKVER